MTLRGIAQQSYIPRSNIPATEHCRWTKLEDLSEISTFYGVSDENDHLWLPNYDGVHFYDGSQLVEFAYPEDYTPSFPNGIHYAKNGCVYVSTEAGLRRFSNGSWTILYEYDVRMDLRIVAFAETPQGTIFVRSPHGLLRIVDDKAELVKGTSGNILTVVYRQNFLWYTTVYSNKIHRFALSESDQLIIDSKSVYSLKSQPQTHRTVLLETQNYGFIAICNDNNVGVLRYEDATDSWVEFTKNPISNEHDIIIEASDGSLMTHNFSNISVYKNGIWREIENDSFNPFSFPFMINNRNGVIVGGFREPIYYIDTSDEYWESYKGLIYQCEDKFDRKWFLDYEDKIVVNTPSTNDWQYFDSIDGAIDLPMGIHCSHHNLIWVYGGHNGTAAFSIFRDGKWEIHEFENMGSRIGVGSVFEDQDGRIYFGSGDDRALEEQGKGGLLICDVSEGGLKFQHITTEVLPSQIMNIVKKDEQLWLGGEFFRIFENGVTRPALSSSEEETNALWVNDIILTNDDNIWVSQRGLGVLQLENQNWIRHTAETGLNSNYVLKLVNDNASDNAVYALTKTDLIRFNGENWSPSIFTLPNPLSDNVGSMYQSNDGSIWINALIFNWEHRSKGDKIEEHEYSRRGYTIRYKPKSSQVEGTILNTVSSYNGPANVIVEWEGKVAWSETNSNNLMYSTRLNGGQWSDYESKTQQILFDLKGGNYTFEVKASDLKGNVDPTPESYSFRVIPPLWKNPYVIGAVVLVILLIIGLMVFIIRLRIRHFIEIEQIKVDFFSKLSHELRTPLTLIVDPIEAVLASCKDPMVQSKLSIASRSVQKMLKLIDQLLDYRKASLGITSSKPTECDLIAFIRSEIELVRPLAEQKDQTIQFKTEETKLRCLIQLDKVESIIGNLLSNAIKYTGEMGRIEVQLDFSKSKELKISISDNGRGISKNDLPYIFDPFKRVETLKRDEPIGSGLGLSITKQLVDTLEGAIKVTSPLDPQSVENPGTRFEVTFPIVSISEESPRSIQESKIDSVEETIHEDESILLIAEDHTEIREYLSEELSSMFKVVTAENGSDAYEKAKSIIPDIIVSDVKMPGTDGYELCKLIKNDDLTSHIPFIMLTALKSNDHEHAGFDSGADEYINKPIRINILKKRLRNLLNNRDAQINHYAKQKNDPFVPDINKGRNKTSSFLEKVDSTLLENLSDHEFRLDEFANTMFMSKMTLHRKLKALTGESPASYLKTMRLKKAAHLLIDEELQVSEVMEQVGFLDMSHFSASFKKQFGVSPSQYAASQKKRI